MVVTTGPRYLHSNRTVCERPQLALKDWIGFKEHRGVSLLKSVVCMDAQKLRSPSGKPSMPIPVTSYTSTKPMPFVVVMLVDPNIPVASPDSKSQHANPKDVKSVPVTTRNWNPLHRPCEVLYPPYIESAKRYRTVVFSRVGEVSVSLIFPASDGCSNCEINTLLSSSNILQLLEPD